jgi:peptidyl-prolyl cis-trans isomerase C
MFSNEHAKPGLEDVRRVLLARACQLGLKGEEDEVIERLLEREVTEAELTEQDCRRYYEQHARRFTAGALVEASHILLAMTARVPPERLRAKAAEVHARATREPGRFAELAREYSNCPSAAQGGALGQIGRGDSVPEFEKAVLEGEALGILPDLVATRFGFHVVLVARRIPGRVLPYEAVRDQAARELRRLATERAIGEYVRRLNGTADDAV